MVRLTHGGMGLGDKIRIQGLTTDFTQTVRSLQRESVSIEKANKGQLVGLKVQQKARVGDRVYRVVGDY